MKNAVTIAIVVLFVFWSSAGVFVFVASLFTPSELSCVRTDSRLHCEMTDDLGDTTAADGEHSGLSFKPQAGRNRPAGAMLGNDPLLFGDDARDCVERLQRLDPGERLSMHVGPRLWLRVVGVILWLAMCVTGFVVILRRFRAARSAFR